MNLSLIPIFCKQRGISIPTLAKGIGVSRPGLYKAIKNNSIRAEILERVAGYLELDIREFFGGEIVPLTAGYNLQSKFRMEAERKNVKLEDDIYRMGKEIKSLRSSMDEIKKMYHESNPKKKRR
jgi:transcriptional regulator with XRE-family HTH domain